MTCPLSACPVPARVGVFFACLLGAWLPVAAPLYWLWGKSIEGWLAAGLYLLFVAGIGLWGRRVHGLASPYRYYGLAFTHRGWLEAGLGVAIAIASLGGLMAGLAALGWLRVRPDAPWQAALLPGLAVGLGVGFAEELLFRGWLLGELERDVGRQASTWLSSGIFALLHFLKPLDVVLATWMQFPGLLLLGLGLGQARWASGGRLWLSVGLHGGLVWLYYAIDTTDWLAASGRVPAWVTGLGDNPLAGVAGVAALGAIALGMSWAARRQTL